MKNKRKKQGLVAIHGRNIDAYLSDLSMEFKRKLSDQEKRIKKNVLEYTTDDAGNIDCFMDLYGDYVKYDSDSERFLYYTGRMWREDREKRMQEWCQNAMRLRRDYTYKKLNKAMASKDYKKIILHVDKCCNQTSIRSLIEGLKGRVAFKNMMFDTKPYLLNVLNGTVDLRSGKLKDHDYRQYITQLIPIEYETAADNSKFESFIHDTLRDGELVSYMQVLLGYCLTGETKEQVVHFLVGNGANGKSTLLSIAKHVMNSYAEVIPAKVLTGYERTGSASPELAQLMHKRLVCCSELNCTDSLNEGKIKIMSSGETLAVRQLYSQAFTYEPEFKCLIDTNYLPQISGTDHGIWRRIRVIPFEHTVEKDKINKNLLNELKRGSKGILAWMVQGAVKYYDKGLPECTAVEKATKIYRRSQDTLGSFIEACIAKCSDGSVRARALYEAYCKYCDDNLLTPMSETKFGKDFSNRGFKRGKDKVSRKYVGIKLKA